MDYIIKFNVISQFKIKLKLMIYKLLLTPHSNIDKPSNNNRQKDCHARRIMCEDILDI